MIELWHIIVAFVQGLVEWLPISSEGQTVLFVYNIGTVPPENLLTLVVWLHLGTTLAVIVRYPRTILDIVTLKDKNLMRLLIIATICTALTAVPLYFFLRNTLAVFHGELVNILVGGLLITTALVLYLPTRYVNKSDSQEHYRDPTEREAAITGFVQGFSVLPGLSRSGVTVSALLLQRVDKEKALRFSFLMSIPAVLGIFALEVIIGGAAIPIEPGDLLIIELIVFATGLVSMEFLIRLSERISFWKLCLLLGVLAITFGLPALLL